MVDVPCLVWESGPAQIPWPKPVAGARWNLNTNVASHGVPTWKVGKCAKFLPSYSGSVCKLCACAHSFCVKASN